MVADRDDIQKMEEELIQRGVIAPPEFTPEEARKKIMEIIVTEGKDSSLGRQIWQYCKVVDFEYEAIRPILEKEPRFFSQLEELGGMQFNLMIQQNAELKRIRMLLMPKIVIEPGIIKNYEKEWGNPGTIGAQELLKSEAIILEDKLKGKSKKTEVDFDALLG